MNSFRKEIVAFVFGGVLVALFYNLSYRPLIEKELKPILKPVSIVRDATITYVLYFEVNSSTVSDTSLNMLAEIEQKSIGDIFIYGYTDSEGDEKYNLNLSEQRAKAVGNKLINLGCDSKLIQIIGKGEEHPVAFNNSKENKQLNRRAVIKWTRLQ